MIKIKGRKEEYHVNNFDYYWNGVLLFAVVSKKGKTKGMILDTVPKKYWTEIFTTPSEVTYCNETSTIPVILSPSYITGCDRFIKIRRED